MTMDDPFMRLPPARTDMRVEPSAQAFDWQAYLAAVGLPADQAPPLWIFLGSNDVSSRA